MGSVITIDASVHSSSSTLLKAPLGLRLPFSSSCCWYLSSPVCQDAPCLFTFSVHFTPSSLFSSSESNQLVFLLTTFSLLFNTLLVLLSPSPVVQILQKALPSSWLSWLSLLFPSPMPCSSSVSKNVSCILKSC